MPTPEERLEELGLELGPAPLPIATYVPAARSGDLLFLSGHGPDRPGELWRGKLGADLGVDEGYAAARAVALNLLATLKAELGDLSRVRRVVKVLGMVNATPDFEDHPKVINGASDLLAHVFGDAGNHARSAVGMASLPGGIPVEIEMIVEVDLSAGSARHAHP